MSIDVPISPALSFALAGDARRAYHSYISAKLQAEFGPRHRRDHLALTQCHPRIHALLDCVASLVPTDR